MAAAGWVVAGAALAAAAKARRKAETDPLTGLPNRRGLARAHSRMTSGQAGVRLVFLDLSGFRAVNGAHGHHIGDQVLKAVAGRLRAALPDGAILARHGGDEFVILSAGADPTAALEAALARPFVLPSGSLIRLGLWTGAAPAEATGLDEALAAAVADMQRRRAEATQRASSTAIQGS